MATLAISDPRMMPDQHMMAPTEPGSWSNPLMEPRSRIVAPTITATTSESCFSYHMNIVKVRAFAITVNMSAHIHHVSPIRVVRIHWSHHLSRVVRLPLSACFPVVVR